ncbi:MAG: hypothetical protein Q8P17_05280 [bacterium]|nr:hypothetical protein [bacterium]
MDYLLHFLVDEKKRYFDRYLTLIRETAKAETESLNAKAEEVRKIVKEKGLDPYEGEEHLADLAYEVGEMAQLMQRSFVLSIFVSMEDIITRLCRHIQKESKQSFSVTDLSGSGIGRSIKYLEKILGKPFPSNAEMKTRFEVAWKVRNALAHAGGVVDSGNRTMIETFISKNPTLLSIDKTSGEVEVSEEYAVSMVTLNEEICNEVSKHWTSKDVF